jgi:hypothetical protein
VRKKLVDDAIYTLDKCISYRRAVMNSFSYALDKVRNENEPQELKDVARSLRGKYEKAKSGHEEQITARTNAWNNCKSWRPWSSDWGDNCVLPQPWDSPLRAGYGVKGSAGHEDRIWTRARRPRISKNRDHGNAPRRDTRMGRCHPRSAVPWHQRDRNVLI